MDIRREEGVALMVAMMAMLLMMALSLAIVLTISSETLIATSFRNHVEGFYAADAVLERAMDDLLSVPDWNAPLNGLARSAFVDGAAGGSRMLTDGSVIDLGRIVAMANCQNADACSSADMDAVTAERPWGANNPRWQLYAYGRLSDLMPGGTVNSSYYVLVMVADDPSENDDNPLQDGATESNPGSGVLAMRAEAFGPQGAHKVIEQTLARIGSTETGPAGVRVRSWRVR